MLFKKKSKSAANRMSSFGGPGARLESPPYRSISVDVVYGDGRIVLLRKKIRTGQDHKFEYTLECAEGAAVDMVCREAASKPETSGCPPVIIQTQRYQELADVSRAYFQTADHLLDFIGATTEAIRYDGVKNDSAIERQILLTLSQALCRGWLDEDELRRLAEHFPFFSKELVLSLNASRQQSVMMAKRRQITARHIIDVILKLEQLIKGQ